jgi:hypothetical protein
MIIKDQLIVAFSTLVLGLGGFAVSAETATRRCITEECACEEALQKNSVEAIEDFLRKYPQSVSGTTACAALGVPPVNDTFDGHDTDDGQVSALHPMTDEVHRAPGMPKLLPSSD